MKTLAALLFALAVFAAAPLNVCAQEYIIGTMADLPDDDLDDNIWQPKSLRAAIQNINKRQVPAKINLALFEYKTFQLNAGLPVIFYPTEFDGKGIILEPSAGSSATYGLWFEANNCELKNVKIRNFNGMGLVWKGSDGLIANSVFCNNNGSGINMNKAHRNRIGDTTIGYYNILLFGNKGNGGNGIAMLDCNDNIVQHCWSGLDSLGNAVPNERYGILIDNGLRNTIRYCTVSGNEWSGIFVDSRGNAANTLIMSNRIGTEYLGQTAIPNKGNGIQLTNSQGDTIRDNTISGNVGNGVFVATTTCRGIVIRNNAVGSDRLGRHAIPNGAGIRLNGVEHNVVQNIISGNTGVGLSVTGRDITIQSNIIGLSTDQKSAIPNGSGISANTIEGTLVVGDTVGELSNVVAGNNGDGIHIIGAAVKNVVVARNAIGANRDTSMIFPNKGSGVLLTHSVENIAVKNNLISANERHGVRVERNVVIFLDTTRPKLYQKPVNVHISDNCIGCAGSANPKLGKHGGSGVSVLNADSIFIDNNTILGMVDLPGIFIDNDSTRFIRITRNTIGPETDAISEQLVRSEGILVRGASDVLIGSPTDPAASNIIRNCSGHGLFVTDTARQVFYLNNSMKDNKLGGIALDALRPYYDNGNSNDRLDADSGSNGLQNTITMTSVSAKSRTVKFSGELQGKPSETYRIDVYLGKALNGTDIYKTQGTIHIGWFAVTATGNGLTLIDTSWESNDIQQFSAEFPFVTATVSGIEGTSAFSLLSSTGAVDIAVEIDTTKSGVDNDGNVKLVATIRNNGADIASTVAVRDSVSNLDVKEMTISKGVIGKYDSTIIATIPQLSPGEIVTYAVYGKARQTGTVNRKVVALPSEVDKYPQNNIDSIAFMVKNVKSTAPVPKFPGARGKDIQVPIRFIWYAVQGASGYHLQVSKGKFTNVGGIRQDEKQKLQNTATEFLVNDSTLTDTAYTLSGLEGNQVYYWRVRGLFSNPGDNVWSDTLSFATASFTSVQEEADKQALRISCHPNPVSGMADISMYVPESENITLSITDVRGKEVLKILDNALLEKGEYRYVVNTSRLPSGVYIMRMSAGRRNTMQRIVIIQ